MTQVCEALHSFAMSLRVSQASSLRRNARAFFMLAPYLQMQYAVKDAA